jgi:phosphohistidine phosphatase
MKTIYIVRHAKSSWSNPNLDDFDRPLNERGLRNAPEMGKRMAHKQIAPDLIITSPAKRALQTAQMIADALNYPTAKLHTDYRLYHAGVSDALEVIRETDNGISTLMLFGHNPGLTDLVNYLSGSDIYNVPTCGVASIETDVDTWREFGEYPGSLLYYDYPKK